MKFDNFEYINEMGMSTSSYDMRKGRGKKVKGVYGFSNQGYVTFSNEKNSLNNKLKIMILILIMVLVNHQKSL